MVDLDLHSMTLILDLDLYIMKMYLYTQNEVFRSRLSKVRAYTAHTDIHFLL